jgi:outer membrane protein OmpA-like peptidoglycan-associated protein
MQVSQARNQSAWQQAYQDALFEFDRARLRPKLEAALKAVQDRLFEVRFHPTDRSELMRLQDAKHKIMLIAKLEGVQT